MNRFILVAGTLLTTVFAAQVSLSAPSPKEKYDHKKATIAYNKKIKTYPTNTKDTTLFAEPNDYIKALKEAQQNSSRAVATRIDVTGAAIEKTFSDKFRQMREALIGDGKKTYGVTSKEKLDEMVKEYSKPEVFDALKDPDARFLALQIRALAPMKSIVFRARDYIKKNSITRTMIVTALRGQMTSIEHFYPLAIDKTNYWEVVFRYVTEPFSDMGPKIDEDAELHNYFSETRDYVRTEVDLLRDLVFKQPTFWWDAKLYAPFANFVNEKDQYIKLGYEELLMVYAGASLNLSGLYGMTAYSFDGLSHATQQSSELFGVDISAIFGSLGAQGMSSYSKFNKVLTQEAPNLFSAGNNMKSNMESSYIYLKAAVQAAQVAYDGIRNRPAADQQWFEARFVTPFTRGGDNTLRNMAVFFDLPVTVTDADGKAVEKYGSDSTEAENANHKTDYKSSSVRSVVRRGDLIKVDLKNFFMNPPQHLNELYPKAWYTKEMGEKEDYKVDAWEGTERLRNYKYGMAAEWNLAPYKKLFPEIRSMKDNPERTKDVGRYIRILSQAWGTGAFAVPLTFFVY